TGTGAGTGETLIAVSFWVAALPRVLDAIEATAAAADLSPVTAGPAGAGLLYVRVAADAASGPTAPPSASVAGNGASEPGGSRAVAGFVSGLRAAVGGPRGAVSVLTAPAAVRDQLAGHGGLNGAVPGLALMRAVKDQFDPGHRMAPGRFPEAR